MSVQTILTNLKAEIEKKILQIGENLNSPFDFSIIYQYVFVRLGLGEIGGGSSSGGGVATTETAIAETNESSGLTQGQSVLIIPNLPVSEVSIFSAVSVVGSTGENATVRIEGSPDGGTNWVTLQDDVTQTEGNDILFDGAFSASQFRITYQSSSGFPSPTLNVFNRFTYKGTPPAVEAL